MYAAIYVALVPNAIGPSVGGHPVIARSLLSMAMLTSTAFGANGPAYRVAADRLECLIKNASKYLRVSKDIYIISMKNCPNIDQNPMEAITQNSVIGPDLPKIVKGSYDQLVVLRRRELECISKLAIQKGAKYYEIFPERCEIIARN